MRTTTAPIATIFLCAGLFPWLAEAKPLFVRELGEDLSGSARAPKWSRDGKRLAHERWTSGAGSAVLYVTDWSGGEPAHRVVSPSMVPQQGSGLEDFFLQAGVSDSGPGRCRDLAWGPRASPETHAHVCVEGKPRIYWSGGGAISPAGQISAQPSWSGDGWTLVYVSARGRRPHLIRLSGLLDARTPKPLRVVSKWRGTEMLPAVSPDGSQVVFLRRGRDADDLWVASLAGDRVQPRRLTRTPAMEFNPRWSPDGERVAFYETPARIREGSDLSVGAVSSAGDVSLRIVDVETGVSQLLLPSVVPSYGIGPAFASNGKWVVAAGWDAKRFDPIVMVSTEESGATPKIIELDTPTLSHRDIDVRTRKGVLTVAYTGLPSERGADRSRRRLFLLDQPLPR